MTAAMPCRALLCCLSLAVAQQRRELKAKAWFGKSNNRKQSVPLEQHDGADASEPYLVHDVEATKKTAITHDRFHGLYPCQIGTPCPSYCLDLHVTWCVFVCVCVCRKRDGEHRIHTT